ALTGALHGASWVPADLQCDPRAIARGLADEAAGGGAAVRTDTPVAALDVRDGRVRGVRLESGEALPAGAVVLAAGPWSAPLAGSAGLELPVEPRKGQLVRLRAVRPDPGFLRRKLVDGSYLLSLTSPDAGRQVSTVVETTWDGHVLVGSSRERCGFDPTVDPALSAQMRARAERLVPGLAGLEVDAAWVGFRPWLPDHLPAIGASRRVDGLWLATGHEGAGVALGPVTGRLVAQQLTGAPPSLALAPFDPDRFA
ncbi:MAG TPA: FAD-binding oxidoreductase, partial [Solirubrobacteraceae bacterium]